MSEVCRLRNRGRRNAIAMKYLQAIALALVVLTSAVSAEIVTLQNCSIDTGSFALPGESNRQIMPLTAGENNSTREGIDWRDPATDRLNSLVVIHFAGRPTNPISDVLNEGLNQCSCETTHGLVMETVTSPYFGWITSCRVKDENLHAIVYVGVVNNDTWVGLISRYEPSVTANLLKNLTVIPKEKEFDVITSDLAQRLR